MSDNPQPDIDSIVRQVTHTADYAEAREGELRGGRRFAGRVDVIAAAVVLAVFAFAVLAAVIRSFV